jgi:three-Cys-motif partner protein
MKKKSSDFFVAREDWSRRKHLILGYYLKPAAPKLKTASRDGRVIVLDGFAGRGQYENLDPGSPVHIATVASECRSWSKSVDIRVFNIEKDPENFKILEDATKKFVENGIVDNFNVPFSDYKNVISEKIGNCPLIAFIDPFKPTDLPYHDVFPLLNRLYLTEIFIIFHTPSVYRVICTLMASAKTSPAQRVKNGSVLDKIFGGDSWKTLIDSESLTSEDVVKCYVERLLKDYSSGRRSAFAYTHEINARYESNLKYHVIFLTSHADGVKLINDAFCAERKDVYFKDVEKKPPTLNFDEFPDPIENQEFRKSALIDQIIDIILRSDRQIWGFEDLVFESLKQQFGNYSVTEHKNAVKSIALRTSEPRLKITGNFEMGRNGLPKFEDSSLLEVSRGE